MHSMGLMLWDLTLAISRRARFTGPSQLAIR